MLPSTRKRREPLTRWSGAEQKAVRTSQDALTSQDAEQGCSDQLAAHFIAHMRSPGPQLQVFSFFGAGFFGFSAGSDAEGADGFSTTGFSFSGAGVEVFGFERTTPLV